VTVLPAPKSVRDLFADLLGRGVEIAVSSAPVLPTPKMPVCTSVYVTERLQTGAIVVADLDLAARSGAALGLIPKGGAEAAVEDRELPKNLLDNFSEVTNIFAGLFNLPGQPHLKQYAVHPPFAALPDDVTGLMTMPTGRENYDLDIDGYGKGRLSVVLNPALG
jgi:hypothetical protein